MKSCTYCGRENADELVFCKECGTEIVVPTARTAEECPKKPIDLTAFNYAAFAVGSLFTLVALYLLSFGPVARWTSSQIIPAPVVTVTNGLAATSTIAYTTTYPAWVGVVYYPAVALLVNYGGNLREPYFRYIEWWEQAPAP